MDLQAWINFRDHLNERHDKGRKAPIFDELRAVIRYVAETDSVVLKGVYDAVLNAEMQPSNGSALTGLPDPQCRRHRDRQCGQWRKQDRQGVYPQSFEQFMAPNVPRARHAMIMKEIYDSACPFSDRDNPEELREFLSPGNGLRNLPWAEWSVAQKNKLTVIKISYERWCRSQGTTARYLSIEEDIPM